MSVLFKRDVQVYVSTVDSGFTTANTAKIGILDGYTLTTKGSNSSSDIGRIQDTPGRIGFKVTDQVMPVTFNFSAYAKPYLDDSSNNTAVESLLYHSLGGIATTEDASKMGINFAKVNELISLYFYISYGDTIYKVSGAVAEQARVSFNIDDLTKVDWNFKAKSFETVSSLPGTYTDKTSEIPAIKNKLSVFNIYLGLIDGQYDWVPLPITGGNITFKNKILFPQRRTLDVSVSTPFDHVAGNREVMGQITCYMHSGLLKSGFVYDFIHTNYLEINEYVPIIGYIGGKTRPYLYFHLPRALIELPNKITQDVISFDIKFSSRESATEANDDISFEYRAVL